MGLIGDVEGVAEDVVHAGESLIKDIASMISDLHGFITDAGLGNVVQELEKLADQANELRQTLQTAAGSTHWSGAAADAFHQHAQQRISQVGNLVSALDKAHGTVATAYAIAGIV